MTMDIAKKTLVDPHLKENLENLEIEVIQLIVNYTQAIQQIINHQTLAYLIFYI
jgi:hypothetical protein